MLIFYAGKYVNAVTAEDLVQDVFLKVWQKRTFLFLKEGIKTYLYRSVHYGNHSIHFLNDGFADGES